MSKLLIQFTGSVIIFSEEIETFFFKRKRYIFYIKTPKYSQISPEDFYVLIWDVELDKTRTRQQNYLKL